MEPLDYTTIRERLRKEPVPALLKYDVVISSAADLESTCGVISTLWCSSMYEVLSCARINRDIELIRVLMATQNVSRVTLVKKMRLDLSVSFKLEFNFTYCYPALPYGEELQKLLDRYEDPVDGYDVEVVATVLYEGVKKVHPWLTGYKRVNDPRLIVPERIS